jgi:hypothetical protein
LHKLSELEYAGVNMLASLTRGLVGVYGSVDALCIVLSDIRGLSLPSAKLFEESAHDQTPTFTDAARLALYHLLTKEDSKTTLILQLDHETLCPRE